MTAELFMSYKEEWRLNQEQVEKAVELYTLDYLSSRKRTNEPNELLLFLYAKGIMENKLPNVRKSEFEELVLNGETPDSRKALERLKTIVTKGETTPTRTNLEPSSLFEQFVSHHPEWNDGISWIVFRNHDDLKTKDHALVVRFQKSGLCYMHACVVLQHYLVAMNNQDRVPMLNMAEYLKKYMPGSHLYEQIWNDKGGDSLYFLKSILKNRPKSKQMISLVNESLAQTDMTVLLKEHGPALVSGLCVTEKFVSDNWQHLGEFDMESFIGRHAMVLVGYREVDGKPRYLLQNWWKSKPFVEVDTDYLLSSDATIHFIKEKQMEMGDYPTSYDTLVECESGMDACENFIPEGANK